MHRDSLRNQWMDSLYNMCGMSNREVYEITSSNELYVIAHNKHDLDYDVYLMTHATLRAGLKRIGDMNIAKNIGKNLKIGLKIIDEAHLEFRNIILIDSIFNVKRNLYLTATDGRSNKDENSIFKHAFSNAEYYKPSALLDNGLPSKWVEYHSIEINSYCKPYIYKFRVAGGRGMNPATYGKWVIQYDKAKTHLKCCRDILKEIYERDDKAKVLVFMPLIELCVEAAYFFTMELSYDEAFQFDLNIKTINSRNSKHENELNIQKGLRMLIYAFTGLLTCIGLANIFASTLGQIHQRKREFARYFAVGLTPKGAAKILTWEAAIVALRPIFFTIVINIPLMAIMLNAGGITAQEFIAKRLPLIPAIILFVAVIGFVGLAYYLGGKKICNMDLVDVIKDDTLWM